MKAYFSERGQRYPHGSFGCAPNPPIRILRDTMELIRNTVGSLPAEQGGLLGSSDGGKTIDRFYWDQQANTSCATYSPNDAIINQQILPDWSAQDIKLVGIVHSHPYGHTRPSSGDEFYLKNILRHTGDESFFAPIVQSAANGRAFQMNGYTARLGRNGDIEISEVPIETIPAEGFTLVASDASAYHSRVEDIYPLTIMRRKTVIVPGCGGAGEYVENLARVGVGKIILMDADRYSETNIATQSVYRDEIGLNKAQALAARVRRIDPEIEVVALDRFLDDTMTDEEFEAIIHGGTLRSHPKDMLMTACTDSFSAQARAANLAMKFGLPYMAAQLYKEGQASEIIFTYPGITPACPRCMLSSRYEQCLESGYTNEVTSHQTPIFATGMTNAMKGIVTLMLLLYREVPGNRFDDALDKVHNRNFLQMRMSNIFYSPIFEREIGKSPYTFFGETLWITQTPDNGEGGMPLCPLCRGIGDLRLLNGSIHDTRIIC